MLAQLAIAGRLSDFEKISFEVDDFGTLFTNSHLLKEKETFAHLAKDF